MQVQEEIKNTVFHTAIIGAGASGLMCAGSFNARKIIIDHNAKPGVKVSISGGGKCNFSNLLVRPTDYLSQNKHFCKNALAAFKPQDFIRLLEDSHVFWEEREQGKLFSFDAQKVVKMLVNRAKKQGTHFLLNTQALSITKDKSLFVVQTSAGPVKAQRVVLACGGLSFPALGASNFGFKIARQLGLTLVEDRPALVGLSFPKELKNRFAPLSGNSLLSCVSCAGKEFTDPLLFTHEGVSGPAVLQSSLYYKPGEKVEINFLPEVDALDLFHTQKNSKHTFVSALKPYLPAKIAHALVGPLERDLANASKAEVGEAARAVNHFTFVPSGTGGYTKAEVTAGGVDTRQINPTTLEVRTLPGLFITGELLDVTGRLGGFNLHWAWASGFSAAKQLEKLF